MDVVVLEPLGQGQGLAVALLQVLLQHVEVPTGGPNGSMPNSLNFISII